MKAILQQQPQSPASLNRCIAHFADQAARLRRERDGLATALHAAVDVLHRNTTLISRQEDTIVRLMDEARIRREQLLKPDSRAA